MTLSATALGPLVTTLVGMTMTIAMSSSEALAQQNVLVVHSYHPELSWTVNLKTGIDQEFKSSGQDVRIFHEFLDAKRYPALEHRQAFLEYLDEKYQDTAIELIMVSDDPGLMAILDVREAYFLDLPVVFMGVNHARPDLFKVPMMSGVFEHHSVTETALEALRQTEAETLIIINDTTETGEANLERIQHIRQAPNAPENIIVLDDVVPDDIELRFKSFSEQWPVLLMGQLRNEHQAGALINFGDGSQLLRSRLPNPIYSHSELHLNNGVVGGKVLNGEHHARQAVDIALRVLRGESIEQIEPILQSETLWMFDAQELNRFNIAFDALPEGSTLFNEDHSFYQTYRNLLWLIAGGFVASAAIIVLMAEVLRRRTIEEKMLRENEQRYRDLAKAGADIFWELDSDLCFSHLSGDTPFFSELGPQQLLGKRLQDVLKDMPDLDFDLDRFTDLVMARQPIDNFIFRVHETDRAIRIFKINGRPIFDKTDRFLGYRGIQREITEEYNLTQTIAYQATYDSLTGLINRNEFDMRLQEAVNRARNYQTEAILCYLDLDQFKIVNDTAGHLVGDQLLAELARLLKQSIRAADGLGRLGGDEFGLLLEGCSLKQGQIICESLVDKIQNYRFKWQGRQFNVGVSIGIVPILPDSSNATELLSRADLACYKAKDLGRGRIYIADHNDAELEMRQTQMARIANVSQAIEENRFYLVQQPILPLLGFHQDYHHAEILLRLTDEAGQIVSPGQFIPIAERYGMISLIDRWVVETIVRDYELYYPEQDTMVSINLSGASLSDDRFIEFVLELIQQSPLSPDRICFEITETSAISHLDQATVFIKAMKDIGVKFALDDFGSGVSSFGYLRSLPVDYLKIDGALVRNIVEEKCDRTIVDLINQVAHMLGMHTIAEFVENEAILRQLRLLEVDYAQGYTIGKPAPLAATKMPNINYQSVVRPHFQTPLLEQALRTNLQRT